MEGTKDWRHADPTTLAELLEPLEPLEPEGPAPKSPTSHELQVEPWRNPAREAAERPASRPKRPLTSYDDLLGPDQDAHPMQRRYGRGRP